MPPDNLGLLNAHAHVPGWCLLLVGLGAITGLLAFPPAAHAASVSFVDATTSTTDLFTYTFTDFSIGTPAPDRTVVVVVNGIQHASAANTPEVTIGGTAARADVMAQGGIDTSTNRSVTGIYSLPVPSGTTATIVVTFNVNMFDASIAVYAAYGITAVRDTASATGGSGASSASVDVNVANGGVIIGGGTHYNRAGNNAAWTGLAEPEDWGQTVYTDDFRSSSHHVASGAENPRTVFVSFGGALDDDPSSYSAVAASYAPRRTLIRPPNNLGLVGYWSFNEGTGTIATDFSGNGNHGTLTDDPTWVNGKRGKALHFNSNNYVVAPNAPSLNPTSAITIATWIKADDWNGNRRFVQKGDGDTQYRFLAEGGTLNFKLVGVTGGEIFVTLPSAGEWHHVVGTYSGSSIAIYVDGVLAGSQAASGSITTTTDNFHIATKSPSAPPGDHFVGPLDEVRIYSRGLTAGEIARLYQSGAVRINASSADLDNGSTLESGLVGHWTFDGGDTNWTSDTAGTTADQSGSGNTGTLTGMNRRTSVDGGKLGQALNFDGSDDEVRLSYTATLNPGTITFSSWFKLDVTPDGAHTYAITSTQESGGYVLGMIGSSLGVCSGGSVVGAVVRQGATFYCAEYNASNITPGNWHHAAGTYDGETVRLYVNGSEVASDTTPSGNITYSGSSNFLCIGDGNNSGTCNGEEFDGLIDNVRIYNRALTPEEVKRLYKLGTVRASQQQP